MKFCLILIFIILIQLHKQVYADENSSKFHILSEESNLFKATRSYVKTYIRNFINEIHIINAIQQNINEEFLKSFDPKFFDDDVIYQIEKFNGVNFPILKIKRNSVFIISDSIEVLRKLISEISHLTFKVRRRFSMIFLTKIGSNEVEEIFQFLWNLHVKNVNLIVEENSKVKLLTYFPFHAACNNTTPVEINKFDTKTESWNSSELFPNKVKNMNNCTLKVGAAVGSGLPYIILENSTFSGIEIEIFDELGKIFNFKQEYKVYGNFPGNLHDNGTATGLMKAVIDREVDVGIGFISLQYTRAKFLSETHAYSIVALAIIIPRGEEYGDFEKFGRPFSLTVWIFVLAIFTLILITIIIVKLIAKKYKWKIFDEIPILDFFSIIFGIPQNRVSTKSMTRYILMVFIIYCLIIRTVYESGLYKTIKSHDRKPELKTISEMIDKKFKFFVYETLAPRVQDFSFYPHSIIYKNSEILNKTAMTIDPKAKRVAFQYISQTVFYNKYFPEDKKVHICKSRLLTSPFVFYFVKNHFLVDDLNDKLELLNQNGINRRIKNKYLHSDDYKFAKHGQTPEKLQFSELRGVFLLLLIAWIISFIVFIMEKSYKACENSKSTKKS